MKSNIVKNVTSSSATWSHLKLAVRKIQFETATSTGPQSFWPARHDEKLLANRSVHRPHLLFHQIPSNHVALHSRTAVSRSRRSRTYCRFAESRVRAVVLMYKILHLLRILQVGRDARRRNLTKCLQNYLSRNVSSMLIVQTFCSDGVHLICSHTLRWRTILDITTSHDMPSVLCIQQHFIRADQYRNFSCRLLKRVERVC